MNRIELEGMMKEIAAGNPLNIISEEKAIAAGVVGLKIFDEPLIGFGSAVDPLFDKLKEPEVIGAWHRSPTQWLPEGKAVISLFFPFTEAVRESNRVTRDLPSAEWVHGRIEGQAFIADTMRQIRDALRAQGIKAVVPILEDDFVFMLGQSDNEVFASVDGKGFGCNWSERHAAFICGLGTFGLSKGIITEKGTAGRFGSIIIDVNIPADIRPYEDLYEYCIFCGACARRCPVEAISKESGKKDEPCFEMMLKAKEVYNPRLGCGKCQTKVPCEDRNPKASR